MFWIACLLLWTGSGATNQPSDKVRELERRIHNINADLARLGDKLGRIETDSRNLAEEIDRLELQRAVVKSQIDKHELELAQANQLLAENEVRKRELQTKIETQRHWIAGRLRNLYKRGALGYAQLFLKQSRRTELINAYHYAKVLTRRDVEALNAYRETIQQLQAVDEALLRLQANAEKTRNQLAEREQELVTLVAKRERRLAAIRREKSSSEKLQSELALQREELQMLIMRVANDDSSPLDYRLPISRYKGRLDWPAFGKILRGFGIYRDPEFNTKRRQNGLLIGAPRGQDVRSVYSGKVVYADWFRGYGNLVIINHGEKILSFYAHCDKLLVDKGDVVDRNQVIAKSGDTGSLEGPLLHFEIREKTEPVDPKQWLAQKGRRR